MPSNPVDIGKNTPAAGTSGTATFTTTSTVAAGEEIHVEVGWFSATATLSSVGATGCTGHVDKQVSVSSSGVTHSAIGTLDCPTGLASGSTVTATFSDTTADSRFIAGSKVSGEKAASAYNSVSSTSTSGTAWTSGTTPVTAYDLLYGSGYIEVAATDSSVASGGNTEVHDFSLASDSAMTGVYQIGTGASVAASGTWSPTAGQLTSVAAAYLAAPAGSPPTFDPVPFMPQGRNL